MNGSSGLIMNGALSLIKYDAPSRIMNGASGLIMNGA